MVATPRAALAQFSPVIVRRAVNVAVDTKKYFELPVGTIGQAVGFAVLVLVVIAVAKQLPLPKVIRP
jgi:hypothetical protein